MRKYSISGLALALFVAMVAPFMAGGQDSEKFETPTLPLDDVLAKIQENYAKIDTYSVEFEQRLYSVDQAKVINSGEGTVIFKKPGKMVWTYTKPEEHIYISDGNTIVDYAPRDKEAYIIPMRDAVYKSFLLGLGDLKRDFETSFHEGRARTPQGMYQIDLVPKDKVEREALGAITIVVHHMDFMVRGTEMVDSLGNHNQLRFKNMKINPPLSDSMFEFKPPPGVKVTNAKDMTEDE